MRSSAVAIPLVGIVRVVSVVARIVASVVSSVVPVAVIPWWSIFLIAGPSSGRTRVVPAVVAVAVIVRVARVEVVVAVSPFVAAGVVGPRVEHGPRVRYRAIGNRAVQGRASVRSCGIVAVSLVGIVPKL